MKHVLESDQMFEGGMRSLESWLEKESTMDAAAGKKKKLPEEDEIDLVGLLIPFDENQTNIIK